MSKYKTGDENNDASLTAGLSRWQGRENTAAVVFAVLFLFAAGFAVYLFSQLQSVKKDPAKTAQEEVKAVVAEVSKLMMLPNGEDPTLATVTDPEKLKDQAFFARAQTGFKVLIYANAKKAILYNPVEKKIVEVAPINIGDSNQVSVQKSNGAQVQESFSGAALDKLIDKSKISVRIENGSGTAGLARKIATILKTAGYVQVSTGDAKTTVETTSIIYGTLYIEAAQSVQALIGGKGILQEQAGVDGVTILLGMDNANIQ